MHPLHCDSAAEPGYRFHKRFGMLALAIGSCLGITLGLFLLAPPSQLTSLYSIGLMGYWALALCVLLCVQYRKTGVTRAILGTRFRRPFLLGLGCIIATYVCGSVSMVLLDLPREPFMVTFYDDLDRGQIALLIAFLILFPPITEELLYRHFLLRLFPYQRSEFWAWTAVLATTVIFTLSHYQYENFVTLATIFIVGAVLAVARVRSGGLLVPVLLHAAAEVAGLATNQILAQVL
ncbi:CPBP family intramembrane metalloprotease [Pseudomonas capeferrum]|uniref:CPBP family intramembrane glutamic endopeptidase n=1 Tax=Pseudomonas capeferrum TaxID=1495066 RepID=UPI0015E28C30|nr:type II CAAX endopeptidase family protein [Pseudomonas capeferrum]MBA1200339.1 CPBP family intramembrane metalloprotease [Pseudomonas capeferrum]